MFKVGDKVKCINDMFNKDTKYRYLTKGKIYTVLMHGSRVHIVIKHDEPITLYNLDYSFGEGCGSYHFSKFELVATEVDYLQIAKDVCGKE